MATVFAASRVLELPNFVLDQKAAVFDRFIWMLCAMDGRYRSLQDSCSKTHLPLYTQLPKVASVGGAAECFRSSRQHYLLLGICGAGMRALCEILLDAGHFVTGTDSQLQNGGQVFAERSTWQTDRIKILPWNEYSDVLRRVPVVVPENSQQARSWQPVTAIVASNAVPDQDDRIAAARVAKVPMFRLTQALSQLLFQHRQLCIAGTHGKTTTSAMLWAVLSSQSLAHAAFVGGQLTEQRRSGFWTASSHPSSQAAEWAVVESCEYRDAFSHLSPSGIVLTGIERDHFDYFPNASSEDQVFQKFANQLPSGGFLAVNAACDRAMQIALRLKNSGNCQVITYGFDPQAEWTARQIQQAGSDTSFLACRNGGIVGKIHLRIPGLHNVQNSLATIAVASHLGVPFADIASHLACFKGVRRRFENRGQWRGIELIDDYAHHPTAIHATLSAARVAFGKRRIIAVFEPHQISRVEQLFEEFGDALRLADECLVLPVLPARELSTRALCCQTSGRLVRSINLAGGRAFLLADLDQVIGKIDHAGRPGDVVITMGAGRTNQIHDEFNRRLQRDSVA